MRPQQNRRISNGRRSNNGAMRRAPNPLARNYESSGPDVKIRGNAQHIADKYLALARDAQASGDRVMGENYLQHAEHYTRIILSAQSHENNVRLSRYEGDYKAEERLGAAPPQADEEGEMPQPVIEGMPGEVALTGRNGGYSAEPQANGADEGEESRPARLRRRLPARRSRESAGPDGAEQLPQQRPAQTAGGNGAENRTETEEEAHKPARARRPRRIKPIGAEQAENL